ncbi:unnamed protein product [Cyclocybe aegerita]|uniref:Uncharacterized protein n=1 Tax=Cyclocybe aegerita TaxID=1973307 RepID=A0A8S0X2M7_CYCAE|nr:unnamed protein product [Cyclocybe aegerita]
MSTSMTAQSLPPTQNTLDREQRSRLLRSARKLEAVLGATPYLLESYLLESQPDIAAAPSDNGSDATLVVVAAPTFTPSPSPSPSTHHSQSKPRSHTRSRPATPQPPAGPRRPNTNKTSSRQGRISPSSSVSSFDPAEPEYVFVDCRSRAAPYTVQFVPDPNEDYSESSAYSTPASSRCPSPMPMPKKELKSSSAPLAVALDLPAVRHTHTHTRTISTSSNKKAKGPQALAQPLLLRLRSVPISTLPPHAALNLRKGVSADETCHGPLTTEDGGLGLKTEDSEKGICSAPAKVKPSTEKKPLSPVSSTFNITASKHSSSSNSSSSCSTISGSTITHSTITHHHPSRLPRRFSVSSYSASAYSQPSYSHSTANRHANSYLMDLPSPTPSFTSALSSFDHPPLSPMIAALDIPSSPSSPSFTHPTRHKKGPNSRSLTDREKRRKMAKDGQKGPNSRSLTDREKRRKMAKLQRTLGENVPPELVFRAVVGGSSSAPASSSASTANANSASSSSSSSVKTTDKTTASASASATVLTNPAKRTSSLSMAVPRPRAIDVFAAQYQRHQASRSMVMGGGVGMPLAVAEAPVPAPSSTQPEAVATTPASKVIEKLRERTISERTKSSSGNCSTSASGSSTASSGSTTATGGERRKKHRPRSLTLGSASAFVGAESAIAASKASDRKGKSKMKALPNSPMHSLSQSQTQSQSQAERQTQAERQAERNRLFPSRGTVSLDSERSIATTTATDDREVPFAAVGRRMDSYPLPGDGKEDAHANANVNVNGQLTVEWGRRKEREWSGEWNKRDMEEVARALRGLKAH